MSGRALSARRPLLDERRYRATLVTGDPLEVRPGAGVENELSAQLGAVFVFLDCARATALSMLRRSQSFRMRAEFRSTA
jgi:hypothetical protein